MLKDVHFPRQVWGAELDRYLAMGWYRIGQVIFTTDHIPHPEGWYRVFWLRFKLAGIGFGKKQQRLLAVNTIFNIEIKPLVITPELEMLYDQYYSYISFDASPTLQNSLFDYCVFADTKHQVFDSWIIEVREGSRLAAAGIFDKGEKSIAGILNFFDPAYKRYSPGKFLMLQKIIYANTHQMDYYYPGYIAADYSKFDYKLFPDAATAEIFDPVHKQWHPYSADLIRQLKDDPPAPAM